MKQTIELIKRNSRLYFRDGGRVFFSMLTMLILVALMTFFLGDSCVDAINTLFEEQGLLDDAVRKGSELYVLRWTIAGILAVNSITVPISGMSIMMKDKEDGTIASIFTAPVSRISITLGYIGSSWLCTMFMNIICLAVSESVARYQGANALSAAAMLRLLGALCICSFVYSALLYIVALLVKTQGAWSGLGTVVSTLCGFLGAIYIPLGALSKPVQTGLKFTPVLYTTAAIRQIICGDTVKEMFSDLPAGFADAASDAMEEMMGSDISIGSHTLSAETMLAFLSVCGIVLLGAAIVLAGRKNEYDR